MSASKHAIDANQPVAVVTGASRGIGRVLALGLLEAGSHVIAIGRDMGWNPTREPRALAKRGAKTSRS